MWSVEPDEELIGTIDVWEMRQLRWPLIRLLARQFVEARELDHYMHDLLASGRWRSVRVTPVAAAAGARAHVFQVYGRAAHGGSVVRRA